MFKKKWRLFAIAGLVIIFAARVYVSFKERERIEEQKQMIEDLSRQQLEERVKKNTAIQINTEEILGDPDKKQAELDSIGKKLRKDHKRFKEKMKHLNKEE